MKLDFVLEKDLIVEEELRHSVVVYFMSFLIYCSIELRSYVPIESLGTFILALILIVICFVFKVCLAQEERTTGRSFSLFYNRLYN